jgi:hypothetical protein
MKKIVVGVLMASFIIASTGLEAQPRGGRGGGGNSGGGGRNFGGGSQPSRSFSQSGPSRSFGQGGPQRSFDRSAPQRSFNQSQPQRSFNQPQRNFGSQPGIAQRNFPSQQRNFTPQRSFTPNRNFGPSGNFGGGRRPVIINRNNFYGGRGGYFAPHYRPVGVYHYSRSPRVIVSIGGPYSTIPWLGIPYNYYNGYWYRPYGTSFQIIAPPIGISIGTLPIGYSPVFGPWGNYYYYNNVFYRHPANDDSKYEVVDAPIGAQVPELPKGAEVRVIDNVKYYELDGTFYKEDLKDGQVWYTIVGKDGVLSTYDENYNDYPTDNVGTGDRVSVLPEGSKAVTINGQQLFLSPNGNYYQQVQDGSNTWYEVVGQ